MKEFAAVVLAGGEGAPLVPLTNNKPKCLLPVGNLPLIYLTLNYIEKEGFQDVYVVTRLSWKSEIENELSKIGIRFERLSLTLKIHYITYNDEKFAGTARLLYLIKENIESVRNVIIFGGDIVGNLESLNELVTLHRKGDSKLSVYMSEAIPINPYDDSRDCYSTRNKSSTNYQLLKSGQLYINSKDIVMIDSDDGETLLYLVNENEIDDNIHFDPMIMFNYPNIQCSTAYHDLHIYIIRYDIIDEYTKKNWDTKVESLRVDIIPQIIKSQYRSHENDTKTTSERIIDDDQFDNPLNNVDVPRLYNFMPVLEYINFGSINSIKSFFNCGDISKSYEYNHCRCVVYVNKCTTPTYRVNSMKAYIRANFDIYDMIPCMQKPLPPLKPGSRLKKNVPRKEKYFKCCIDGSATFADSCYIRHSNLGSNCVIKDGSYINQTTIFNNVTIGNNCHLENCIIANHTVILDNCTLKNCIVGPKECISANSSYEDEKIVGAIELLID